MLSLILYPISIKIFLLIMMIALQVTLQKETLVDDTHADLADVELITVAGSSNQEETSQLDNMSLK